MARYQKKPLQVDAIELIWENWGEICELIDVGPLAEGRPAGTFLNQDREPIEAVSPEDGMLGLLIPTDQGLMVAAEHDMIIRDLDGRVTYLPEDLFNEIYEPVPDMFEFFPAADIGPEVLPEDESQGC